MYSEKVFETVLVDPTKDQELATFITETLTRGPKFANYTPEKLEYFVSRIYELRKDNSNNTAR